VGCIINTMGALINIKIGFQIMVGEDDWLGRRNGVQSEREYCSGQTLIVLLRVRQSGK
jgi:hypothetical protein